MRAARLFALAALALAAAGARAADDVTPPVITFTPPVSGSLPKGPLTISAKVTDESKCYPQVFYRHGPGQYEKGLDMKKTAKKDVYEATIPYKGDKLEFYLEAYDDFGNGPARAGDPEAPFKVTLGEVAPPVVAEKRPAPGPAPGLSAAPSGGTATRAAAGGGMGGGRIWTWVVGGAGVGLLTGGLLAGLAVKSADDAFNLAVKGTPGAFGNTTVPNTAALAAQADANKSLGTKATILTISGLVLLGGAAGLWFLEAPDSAPGPARRRDSDAVIGAAPAPGHGITVAAGPIEGGAAALVAGRV